MKGYVITVHPEGRATAEAYDPEAALVQLQNAVGGHIETVPHLDTVTFGQLVHALNIRDLELGQQPCIAFCDEEGKLERKPLNVIGTQFWAEALVAGGHAEADGNGTIRMTDVLLGPVAFVVGAEALAHWNRPE